jgi:Na+-driven multidrug efflux pump
MAEAGRKEVFETMPPARAILTLAVPTIIAQLVTVFYTVADLFYVGQLGDPAQVAAVRLAFPPFLALTALANLFGIGAASAIGRALGVKDEEKARACSAFALWSGAAIAILYSSLITLFQSELFPLMGVVEQTRRPTALYLFWVVTAGSLPLIVSNILAHLVRAEGHARVAGNAIMLGGVFNVLIAPAFIFWMGLEIEGAGLAVFLSNVVSALYIARYAFARRDTTVVRVSPRFAALGVRHAAEIVTVGFASFVMTGMACVVNMIFNTLSVGYGVQAMAGLGLAKQIDQLIFTCAIGLGQGVLPLIAYNYSSGNIVRLKAIARTAAFGGVAAAAAASLLMIAFAPWITAAFIDEPVTNTYAAGGVRLIALACPMAVIGHLTLCGFQACAQRWQPLLLAIMRKGVFDIPFMLVFARLFGVYGIAAAMPAAEFFSMSFGLMLALPFLRKLSHGTPAGAARPEGNRK